MQKESKNQRPRKSCQPLLWQRQLPSWPVCNMQLQANKVSNIPNPIQSIHQRLKLTCNIGHPLEPAA